MRIFAILLVPAFIGFVSAQFGNGGQYGGQHGVNYGDQGRHPGGSSKLIDPWNAPPPGQGGYGQGGYGQGQGDFGQGIGFMNQNPGMVNQGQAPPNQGGTSNGRGLFDFAQGNQQPQSNNVNHQNVGQAPVGQGGSSGGLIIPDGPVQTGMRDQVNMVNAGAAPAPGEGNSPNSGEFLWDTGLGAANTGAGMANNAPQGGGSNGNNQVAYGAGGGYNAGGRSNGNGGPAYAAAGDNTGANAPLGGALLTDLNQQEAGTAGHSKAAAGMGSTVAGVVVAVLVLVGVVAVAAVFIVKQRASRMMVQSV